MRNITIRERALALERFRQTRCLKRCRQRLEIAGRNRRIHDVLFGIFSLEFLLCNALTIENNSCPIEQKVALLLFHDFFSRAENLEAVTPAWLHFSILVPCPVEMKTGTRIRYRLRLHGIPLRWESEITSWEPPYRFVDEQRTGPYCLWIHEHQFLEHEGGTTVRDTVQYSAAGGELVHRVFIAPDLHKIFEFRRQKVVEIFRER